MGQVKGNSVRRFEEVIFFLKAIGQTRERMLVYFETMGRGKRFRQRNKLSPSQIHMLPHAVPVLPKHWQVPMQLQAQK